MKELFKRCYSAEYVHTVEDGDYAIQREGDKLYILFQWSNSHMDWISNLNFPAKAYKHGDDKWYVHRGFLRVWKAMRDAIEQEVKHCIELYPIKEIVCAGYSHGAAIALLATEDMLYHYGHKMQIQGYGFGCPRVIWGLVPKGIKERLRHFTPVRNVPDIVTHLPPVAFGFRHFNLYKIGKAGKYSAIDAHRAESYLNEL